MKKKPQLFTFLLSTFFMCIFFVYPKHAQAENNNNGIVNYVPPALFSQSPTTPSSESDIVVPPPAPRSSAPSFVVKVPVDATSNLNHAPTPNKKPKKVRGKVKKKSSGIVKGKKTMPSNKKTGVQVEEIFKAVDDAPIVDLKASTEVITPIADVANTVIRDAKLPESFELPVLELLPDNTHKLIINYKENQLNVSSEHATILNGLIIPKLDADGELRLIIQAYASVQDEGLGAARRKALSRALAIRDYLLKEEVSPHRIDVRSLGGQSDIEPLDRVEFYLLK